MKYKPGQSGNPNGRPKGSKNKAPVIAKEAITELLAKESEELPELLKELTPRDRVQAFVALAKFVIPTLKATELQADIDGKVFQKIRLPEWLEEATNG